MIKKETIYSGIIGAVVADALGVPYEFSAPEDMRENPATTMTGHGMYNQPVGTWSDDSSMTLATMDSLLNGIDYEDMMDKFSQWVVNAKYTPHDNVFDCGITTRSAIYNYFQNHTPALESGLTDEHSNGNGSLMRILPVSLYSYAKKLSVNEQMELIDNTSSLTHAHKISKASCNIYNFIVQEVLENPREDFKELIKKGLDKSRKYYDNSEYSCFNRIYDNLFMLTDDDIESKGYVVYSLEVALYSCYHTDSYKEAVLKSVNYGRDTDTNAIITGGLAALYYGYDSIPPEWIKQIVRLDYIKDLCDKFSESLQ